MKQIVWIKTKSKLCFKANHLVIEKEDEKKEIYLGYISSIIIDTLEVSITAYLINELIRFKIDLLFTNEKHIPSYRLEDIYSTYNQTERLNRQLKWSDKNKDKIWDVLIKDKLKMQQELIERLFEDKDVYKGYIKKVKKGDVYNCEAFVARKYFYKLFGSKFIRHKEDDINFALNYGYTLLLTTMLKIINLYGYFSFIGIHHRSNTNSFNLGSDVMEPFRPIVDEIVYENRNLVFDKDYKRKLLSIFEKTVVYKNKECLLENAMEYYFIDVITSINENKNLVGELVFG